MGASLSVQLAARRLGVSPHTVRRWTASGFLPCTRTAGGHRRFRQEDIDELLGLLEGGTPVAARFARERELETLAQTSLAVSSQLELPRLLAEIARQMTSLLDSSFCAVNEYDAETQMIRMLADYDRSGRRRPDWEPYPVKRFPITRAVLDEKRIEVVNASDAHADAAELAYLRRSGYRSIMLVPLIYRDQPIGLLEIIDRDRERRYTRQELRICRTVAAQAAVALNNAKLFSRLRRRSSDVSQLCFAIEQVAAALPRLNRQSSSADVLKETAALACEALAAVSSVAAWRDESAGASAPRWPEHAATTGAAARSDSAHLLTAAAPCGPQQLTVTTTLAAPATDGQTQLLTLICSAAATALQHLLPEG